MASITRHLPAEERKAITVATVIELAARQNPGEITTAAIAQQMQLTQGALFRHFPTKDAIWLAVMEWISGHLLAKVELAAGNAATPCAALDAIFAAHIEFIMTHPGVPRILLNELQRAEDTEAKQVVRSLLKKYSAQLILLLEQGKKSGELAKEINVTAAAAFFLGMIQGLVLQTLISANPEDMNHLRQTAGEVFILYRRSIRSIS